MVLFLRQLIPLVVMLAVLSALSESSWAALTPSELAKSTKAAEKAAKAADKAAQKAAQKAAKDAEKAAKEAEKQAKEAAKNPWIGSPPSGGSITIEGGGSLIFDIGIIDGITTISGGTLQISDGLIYGPGNGPPVINVGPDFPIISGDLSYLPIPSEGVLHFGSSLTFGNGHTLLFSGGGSLVLQDGARLTFAPSGTITLASTRIAISGSGSLLLPNGETIPFSEGGTLLLPTGESVNIPISETWILTGDGTILTGTEEAN
jgi:hypothetical protein